MKVGPKTLSFPGVGYPLLQTEPEVGPDWVKFVQSAGGRMGLPAPRRVSGKPYFQVASASAWTTLQLIIYADGTSKHRLIGASPFPRHWIYDDSGTLVDKSGEIDFERWWRESFGPNTPWGGDDSPTLVAAVESELERQLSRIVMADAKVLPRHNLAKGETLVEQFDSALGRIVSAMRAAGAEPDDLVSLVVYTTAIDEYRASTTELGEAWRRHFGRRYPAMALVGVAALMEPGAKVELMGVAALPDG